MRYILEKGTFLFCLTGLFLMNCAMAQGPCGGATPFRILHFTKTNGFDHNTRLESARMFREIGQVENFTVTNTQEAAIFDELDTLQQFEVIVFSNTSGNNLLAEAQQQNLEAYIAGGGSFLGIHAATDTYRNGRWPFYNQLVGGIVQANPNHTSANHVDTMDVMEDHPSVAGLPDPWVKEEEYYYWDENGGRLYPNIRPVLRVRETGNRSYDRPRPISWYQEFDSGARSFYTALGHKRINFTDPDNLLRVLLRNALCWCAAAGSTVSAEEPASLPAPRIYPNPVRDMLWVKGGAGSFRKAEIYDLHGQLVHTGQVRAEGLRLRSLHPGVYVLKVKGHQPVRFIKY